MTARCPLPVASFALSVTALCVCLSLIGPLGVRTEAQATVINQASAHQPKFVYSEWAGCGNVYVFAANTDRSEVIWVDVALIGPSATASKVLPLPPPPSVPLKLPWVSISAVPVVGVREYDVAMPKDGLRAGLDFNAQGQAFYCTDLLFGPPITWPAVAGHLTLTIRHPEAPTIACEMDQCHLWGYPVELKVDRMTFQRPDGRRVDLPAPLTLRTYGGLSSGG